MQEFLRQGPMEVIPEVPPPEDSPQALCAACLGGEQAPPGRGIHVVEVDAGELLCGAAGAPALVHSLALQRGRVNEDRDQVSR